MSSAAPLSPGSSPLHANDFDYQLDESLIAQRPAEPRDLSRLMVLNRGDGRMQHRIFRELPDLLIRGDLLIVNDTRVIPSRFFCRRCTGGRIEGLFLNEPQAGRWAVLLKGAGRCRAGERLRLQRAQAAIELYLVENLGEGRWLLDCHPPVPAAEVLASAGVMPLPPYIRRNAPAAAPADSGAEGDSEGQSCHDRHDYQTVYANRAGAAAAPTAGLHFTPALMERLAGAGIGVAHLTLHVGLGTFLPVKADMIGQHRMHREWYELPGACADAINLARREGRRVVAVGTTSVRVLETAAREQGLAAGDNARLRPAQGWTDIFIYPPYRPAVVDALITNFHLPRSTLLMLVAAFCSPGGMSGIGMILDAYRQAVAQRYRFYSYGDAMLIE